MAAGRSLASTMRGSCRRRAADGHALRQPEPDPGVILYLMDELRMVARATQDLIYKVSGLLGASGFSSEMRALLASDDARSRFASDLYVYRIGRERGSLVAAAPGIDALMFTAGIGGHAAVLRERLCREAA
ncbi:hypothetical protein [Variovorax saccharolyticus]|uniref:hypothetical protein n=1 Tax=Variovorax saccharolyticus TaxID=3053516 RepID=UPI002575E080|nr:MULTISPECIES: hypothetical protein [unclassified Variovorax]MDM0022117.1 hypothetical protein [Variovorax sp. J22R187]MDM0030295.1 hypothetical protein [Variovorax sp. J31P216]